MLVKKDKNSLYIKSKYFSAYQIVTSGQVFRFYPYKDGYLLISGGELAHIVTKGEETYISCSDEDYFYNYFDLDTDYSNLQKQLNNDELIEKAVEYGKGIRILNQQKLETIISFIISANNNIKRISGIIEKICNALGDKKTFSGIDYYTFPTAQKLAGAGTDFYKKAGAGYRAEYISDTACKISGGFDIESIANTDTKAAEKMLLQLKGVGKKVAHCILLFGYKKTDVCPADTWIQKAYCIGYQGQKACPNDISEFFVKKFGNLSGYAQQYLFYYLRENKGEIL